jgi:hypothetical protein
MLVFWRALARDPGWHTAYYRTAARNFLCYNRSHSDDAVRANRTAWSHQHGASEKASLADVDVSINDARSMRHKLGTETGEPRPVTDTYSPDYVEKMLLVDETLVAHDKGPSIIAVRHLLPRDCIATHDLVTRTDKRLSSNLHPNGSIKAVSTRDRHTFATNEPVDSNVRAPGYDGTVTKLVAMK